MRTLVSELAGRVGAEVTVAGWVHRVRDLGKVCFVVLRDRSGMAQLVFDAKPDVAPETVIRATGEAAANEKAPGGVEVRVRSLEVLSPAAQDLPFPVNQDPCTLICGGWGGSLTGLSCLDGLDASENESTNSMAFKDGKWYKIRLRVTPEKIGVWVDDEQIVDVKIAGRKVSLRWEMDPMPPLGFATYATKGGLKNIVMKPL